MLVMFILIICASCTQEDFMTEESSINSKFQTNGITMPHVENGILFFNSKEHVNNYFMYLDTMVNDALDIATSTNNPQDETDEDTILDQFETQFSGFTSYRKLFNQQHDFKNQGHTKQEIKEIFENSFVNGYERSYFNNYLELGIGNKIYVYFSKDIRISFDKDRQDILNKLREEPRGGVFPASIMKMKQKEEIQLVSNTEFGNLMHLQVDQDLSYDSYPVLQNKNCSVYEKGIGMFLDENIMSYYTDDDGHVISNLDVHPYPYNFSNLTIDWGDGNSSTSAISSYGSLLWHTYASTGNYNALVTISFYDADGFYQTMSDPQVVKVLDACSEANGSVSGTVDDGNWMAVGELTVSDGWFGANRIEGTTTAFKSCGSDCWFQERRRSRKPYNKVYISGVFRDENCTSQVHKEGSGISNHANTKTKIKTKYKKRYDHSNGDVRSEHRVIKDGSSLALDLTYNPC